jgi:hypothetical protein
MAERIYNFFSFFDNAPCSTVGCTSHEHAGSDIGLSWGFRGRFRGLEAVKESRFPRRKCLFGFVGAAAFLWPHERACEA